MSALFLRVLLSDLLVFFSPLDAAEIISREICKAKRRWFASLSFLAASPRRFPRCVGIPDRRLRYIHAGFTRDIFVLKSRIPVLSYPPLTPKRQCDFAVFVSGSASVPSCCHHPFPLLLFLASSRVFMRAGWQKRREHARGSYGPNKCSRPGTEVLSGRRM